MVPEYELYHYGVKGMKWGVRRYQNKDGTLTVAGKQHYSYRLKNYTSPSIEKAKAYAKSFGDLALRMLVPGYALASTAAHLTKSVNTAVNMADNKDYTKSDGPIEKLSDLKRKTSETTTIDDMRKVNPRIGKQRGTVNNCMNCTVAMEMRARGYDVRARKRAQGMLVNDYKSFFEGVDIIRPKFERSPGESRQDYIRRTYDTLCKQIEKLGNGARGCVNIHYEKLGSGHTMYWKVDNDRVGFYDGQGATTRNDKLFALSDPSLYSYARLDNTKPTEKVTEAVVSTGRRKDE